MLDHIIPVEVKIKITFLLFLLSCWTLTLLKSTIHPLIVIHPVILLLITYYYYYILLLPLTIILLSTYYDAT